MTKNEFLVVKRFLELRDKYKEEHNLVSSIILAHAFQFWFSSENNLKKGATRSFTVPIANCIIEAATVLSDLGYSHYSIKSLQEDGIKIIIRNNL